MRTPKRRAKSKKPSRAEVADERKQLIYEWQIWLEKIDRRMDSEVFQLMFNPLIRRGRGGVKRTK